MQKDLLLPPAMMTLPKPLVLGLVVLSLFPLVPGVNFEAHIAAFALGLAIAPVDKVRRLADENLSTDSWLSVAALVSIGLWLVGASSITWRTITYSHERERDALTLLLRDGRYSIAVVHGAIRTAMVLDGGFSELIPDVVRRLEREHLTSAVHLDTLAFGQYLTSNINTAIETQARALNLAALDDEPLIAARLIRFESKRRQQSSFSHPQVTITVGSPSQLSITATGCAEVHALGAKDGSPASLFRARVQAPANVALPGRDMRYQLSYINITSEHTCEAFTRTYRPTQRTLDNARRELHE